ncbi:hypothetical protein ACFYZJ_17685 [Streptomyces sp. NPDC001848]|uniref:hypothetical protein n=1 Tax=Streptomyces sp. NPDC001848 TaxID=3364618 RepID=UPI0036C41BD0
MTHQPMPRGSIVRKCLASWGVATAVITSAMVFSPAANAAERNYEVVICSEDGGLEGPVNVGGWNQNNQYVHTPNFMLYDTGTCGHQPHWWFKPNQTVEINVKINRDWTRYFRNLKTDCSTGAVSHPTQIVCAIP